MVLERFGLRDRVPSSILDRLQRGAKGELPETPKTIPANVVNRILGSNRVSLDAAAREATARGYGVLDLGSFIEGETRDVATAVAGIVRSIQRDRRPFASPVCLLLGGETTVTLGDKPGTGGRNQEFALALLAKLCAEGMKGVTALSGGSDGEDGPTGAAGAIADAGTLARAAAHGRSVADHLLQHDSYPFFDATGDLIRCGLTGTNVMDVRVVLVNSSCR